MLNFFFVAWLVVFKSNERNEYSYRGLADFFSGEILKICSRSIFIFRGLTCNYFLSSVHFFCWKEGKIYYRTADL